MTRTQIQDYQSDLATLFTGNSHATLFMNSSDFTHWDDFIFKLYILLKQA
jgi:predicted class III extradiol MEMO1 family dioxygenase